MDIRTYYDPKPIPYRNFDWEAIDWETHDYDTPVGHGATKEEAIADLLWQLDEIKEAAL